MLDDYRSLGWLGLIDGILGHMSKQISAKRSEVMSKLDHEVVPHVCKILRKQWDSCITMDVEQLSEGDGKYKVDETASSPVFPVMLLHNVVTPATAECSCGRWQDFQYPCIHAVAFYQNWEEKSFNTMLEDNVSVMYKFKSMKEMYKNNIFPVVVDVIRHSGGPKMKRIRNRCKFMDPNNSTITYSKCGKRGDNKRTCIRWREGSGKSNLVDDGHILGSLMWRWHHHPGFVNMHQHLEKHSFAKTQPHSAGSWDNSVEKTECKGTTMGV